MNIVVGRYLIGGQNEHTVVAWREMIGGYIAHDCEALYDWMTD